jgi:mediator of RNA polymerase II transcription subunit 21
MSSDILTQLQTCYDQLLIQFFSTISHNHRRHPLVAPDPVPGEPYSNPPRDAILQKGHSGRHRYVQYDLRGEDTNPDTDLQPHVPDDFDREQQELAEDLVRKCQQIEYLIRRLPGLGHDENEQNEEIKSLVEQVRQMEARKKEKRREMKECLKQLDDVVLGMATSIDSTSAARLP